MVYKDPPSEKPSDLIGQLTQCFVIGRKPQACVGKVTAFTTYIDIPGSNIWPSIEVDSINPFVGDFVTLQILHAETNTLHTKSII